MIKYTKNELIVKQEFLDLLRKEFLLSEDAIKLALKHSNLENAPLAIILKNLGLITLDQYQILLDKVYK